MVLRFLASVFMLVAVVAFVADVTKPLAGSGPFVPTTIAREWQTLAPASMQAAQKAVARSTTAVIWDKVLAPAMSLPIFVLFGALGIASGYAGRRRHKVEIYTN